MATSRHRLFPAAALALGSAILLSGCAFPPAVALVSYAFDGLSYLSSGKSMSDHALSAVADQDCALFRIVIGEEVCRETDAENGGTVVADSRLTPWEIEPAAGGQLVAEASGDAYFTRGAAPRSAPVVAASAARPVAAQAFTIEGLTAGTEVFALMQDDGALEVFAHDPRRQGARANLRMILKIDDYARTPSPLTGFRLNGSYIALADITV